MGDPRHDSRPSGSRSTRMSNGGPVYTEEPYDMRTSSSSAGPSSASSSHPPSSFSQRTGTSTSSVPSPNNGDGFLGVVARWGEEAEKEKGKSSVRTSRMLGSKFGLSPPPPPGPPPSEPPPLPPSTTHPFANPTAFSSRSAPLNHPAGRLSTVGSLRQAGTDRTVTPPLHPPPVEGLPPIPTQTSPPKRPPSTPSHTRNASASSSRYSIRSSSSQPSSPNPSGPSISPRNSSLFIPAHIAAAAAGSPSLDAPFDIRPSPMSRPRGGRVPSRHLLQTALDLAQKAVEMDKNNDVIGALAAYREAVARLKNVMDRVGVEPSRDQSKRRRSTGKHEEEGRTLRGIHDAYVARIQLLSTYKNGNEPFPAASMSTANAGISTSTLVPSRSSRSNGSEPVSGERTPRASLDESGVGGIGDLMLADAAELSFDSSTGSLRQHIGESPGRPPGKSTRSPTLPSASRSLATLHEGQSTSPAKQILSPPIELNGLGITSTDSLSRPPEQPFDDAAPTFSPLSMSQLIVPPPRRESIGLGYPSSFPSMQSHQNTSSSRPNSREGGAAVSGLRRPSRPSLGLDTELGMNENELEEGMEVLAITPMSSVAGSPQTGNGGESNRPGLAAFVGASPGGTRRLPPTPLTAPFNDSTGPPMIRARKTSLNALPTPAITNDQITVPRDLVPTTAHLVSEITAEKTISQRRLSRNPDGTMEIMTDSVPSPLIVEEPPTSSIPFPSTPQRTLSSAYSATPSPFISEPRIRAKSQPKDPSSQHSRLSSQSDVEIPPLPLPLRKKASFPEHNHGLRINTDYSSLAPPSSHSTTSAPRSLPHLPGSAASGSLISPLPEAQPTEPVHRPFHLLRILCASMDPESSGSYLTGAIHISSAVWKPSNWAKASSKSLAPPKITAQDVKVRCIEALLLHFEIIRQTGSGLLDGPREGRYGQRSLAFGTAGQRSTVTAEEFCGVLDGLDEEMDQGYKALVKGGVGVGGWKGKKTGTSLSWGSRISKTMDKMTNNKALDSPDRYVDLLASLCLNAQIIDDHLQCFSGPCTPAYHSLSDKSYRQIEARITRAAEFVGAVIVPFVLDDFRQFFLRYLKGGIRYLED